MESLDFPDQREAWLRIFGILFDGAPDKEHERQLPFPWVATLYRNGAFEIWYRRLSNGNVDLLRVERLS